ncbi:uncharacterized protein LAESUDRAFT_724301 [Laetiporus sulphureus 93-53]|uniref:DUF6534 domain-containing protein n=1 Tax=Laetiporus sulphureus 93-53 TaxID=1314785 RepID=A0A165F368_9APHY|nr:uncharacterized protein LAESUDRAFT_724301 [Laetiporus sulphureus 93-53]KZT08281.1 hypothetical protein LAESUDRAFT_724301 [Laetiporus sulphureus 93-53]
MVGLNLHLNSTEGCTFIGILFSLTLYGITLAQTLFYVQRYSNDHVSFKALTAALWILDTAKEMITLQILYFVFVQGHGNILSLLTLPRTYGAEHALAATTVFVVHSFYIHNVWRMMTKKRYQVPLTVVGLVLALTSYAASWGVVYRVYGSGDLASDVTHVLTPGRVQAAFASATDIYIATSMCLVLREATTGFGPTQTVVAKLISYAINRGVVLTVLQILQVGLTASTDTELDQIFYFPLSTVYVNSVLAVLNARGHLREKKNGTEYALPLNESNVSASTFHSGHHQAAVMPKSRNIDIC